MKSHHKLSALLTGTSFRNKAGSARHGHSVTTVNGGPDSDAHNGMHRALPISRQTASTAGRVLIRISRRRLTTEIPPLPTPKKKRRVFRNVMLATATVATGFYIGSTFIAFNSQPYHDFFTERVPLGRAFIEFGQVRHWDTLTLKQIFESGKNAPGNLQRFVSSKFGGDTPEATLEAEKTKKKESSPSPRRDFHHHSADRLKSVASTLKTNVERTEHELSDKGRKAVAIARHQSSQFSEGVEDLIRKAEAALASTVTVVPEETISKPQAEPAPPGPSPSTLQPLPVPIVSTSSSQTSQTSEASQATTSTPSKSRKEKPVYSTPLPIGFEAPPGYSALKSSKRDLVIPPRKAEPRPPPLPQITPAVVQIGASDPVIVQLASTIDDLASYLKPTSSVATKAGNALELAKSDLTQLATRLEKVKEEGQALLEQRLDEQTREFAMKLLELEMEARDKLDVEKDGSQSQSDEERAVFQQAFRKKVDEELRRQTEQINEQFQERLTPAGIEMQQRFVVDLKDRMEHERSKRLAKLDGLSADVKRLERVVLDNAAHLDESARINELWTALRALNAAVEAPMRKPFREELHSLRSVNAAKEDPVISSTLESLNRSDIPDIGVEPLGDLASWFTTSVVPNVSNVALVPDENAGVLSHLASHLLSSLRFQRHGLVPGSDVLSVLARAEYYLNGKDLDSAARELNQLRGTSKVLLSDWLDAARRRLEVQHALEVIETQATLATQPIATSP